MNCNKFDRFHWDMIGEATSQPYRLKASYPFLCLSFISIILLPSPIQTEGWFLQEANKTTNQFHFKLKWKFKMKVTMAAEGGENKSIKLLYPFHTHTHPFKYPCGGSELNDVENWKMYVWTLIMGRKRVNSIKLVYFSTERPTSLCTQHSSSFS